MSPGPGGGRPPRPLIIQLPALSARGCLVGLVLLYLGGAALAPWLAAALAPLGPLLHRLGALCGGLLRGLGP